MSRCAPLGALSAWLLLLLTGSGAASAAPTYRVAYVASDGVYLAGNGIAPHKILPGADHADLSWSPDGRYLAFSRHDPEGIYVATADGRQHWRIARREGAPRWSPNGRRIAYASGRTVHVVGWDGRGARRVISERGRVAWLDSTHVVCACLQRLVVADADAPGSRTLATRATDGLISFVAVSSDGARIAYGRHCYGTTFGGDTFCDIAVINADGTGVRTVVPLGAGRTAGPADFDPVWIPGSDRLLVPRYGYLHDLQGVQVGTRRRTTLRQDAGVVSGVAPDGSFAYAQEHRVLICAPDGSVRDTLALARGERSPAVVFH